MSALRLVPIVRVLTLAVCVATPLVGVPVPARAQSAVAGADPLFKLDPTTRRQVEGLRDSAIAIGLPGRQLVLKALEGNAKKVDPKKIVIAVRQLFVNLKSAHEALGTADEDELVAAASALNSKVTPAELTEFKSFSRGRSPVRALDELAELIDEGVPRNDAVGTFLKLWKGGSTDSDFEGLLQRINQDVHSGVTPGAALVNRARDMPTRPPRPPGDPEKL